MIVRVVLICLTCALAGCRQATRDFQSPVVVPSVWTQAREGSVLPDQWWTALGDPSLTPVRAQVSEDLLALESLPTIDIEGERGLPDPEFESPTGVDVPCALT